MKTILGAAALLAMTATTQAADRLPEVNYLLRCQGCHLSDGTGLPSAGIPDFVGQVGVFLAVPEGREYIMHVPGVIGSSLSDKEIAELMNYILDTWAGASVPEGAEPFTAEEVAELRGLQIGNVVKYRRVVVEKLAALGLSAPDYPWP